MAETFIDIDVSELTRIVEELVEFPEQIKPAIVRAINSTLTTATKATAQEIRKEYAVGEVADIKGGTIKIGTEKVKIKGVFRLKKATRSDFTAALIAGGGQTGLYKFRRTPKEPPPKQRYKNKVRVMVKKSGGKKVVKHNGNLAFLQPIHGRATIFAREGRARFPIKKLYSLSVPQMISDKAATKPSVKRIQARVQQELSVKVQKEIKYRLSLVGKGGNKP